MKGFFLQNDRQIFLCTRSFKIQTKFCKTNQNQPKHKIKRKRIQFFIKKRLKNRNRISSIEEYTSTGLLASHTLFQRKAKNIILENSNRKRIRYKIMMMMLIIMLMMKLMMMMMMMMMMWWWWWWWCDGDDDDDDDRITFWQYSIQSNNRKRNGQQLNCLHLSSSHYIPSYDNDDIVIFIVVVVVVVVFVVVV